MKQQKLLSLIRQAIQDYNMIEDGDRIAVGVSGGKDSLTLLYAMKLLQEFYPKRFELSAITCNVGFEGMDFTGVAEFCKHLEIPYEQVDTEIAQIVFQENKDAKCNFYFPISPICVTLTNELFNFFVTITKVIGSLKRENNMEMHITICREGCR